jgi:structural maintenance of chromosome 4
MIIHELRLLNFKSYNGAHVLGPFDAHFNCVIGPNGNGKSNIIDAVLFVFGFKSSKLRQDSLASLIHRSAFAQPDKAAVAVVFNDQGEKITVSRSVTRCRTTAYKLNGQKITWTDLREKLVAKKIDLNKNLFIILQGEVERLCELSP